MDRYRSGTLEILTKAKHINFLSRKIKVLFFQGLGGGSQALYFKHCTGNCRWCQGGPPGAVFHVSPSGWFDIPRFNMWFDEVFLAHIAKLPKESTKILIGDNLSSHLSAYVIGKCEENNVRFCLLPENSTHLLQPLDVSVFAPSRQSGVKP